MERLEMVQQPTAITSLNGELFAFTDTQALTLHARFAILVHIRTSTAIFLPNPFEHDKKSEAQR
jgi:hypothetical protein